MGDHRASIKIEFSFHGKTKKADMWINYCPDDSSGVDERILEFFREGYREGMNVYEKQMADYWEKEHSAEIEDAEKKELQRLTNKYGKTSE